MKTPPDKVRIIVLASGQGTNFQALLDAERAGLLEGACIAGLIAGAPGARVLERARLAQVKALVEEPDPRLPQAERRRELSDRILQDLQALAGDMVILAGFLSILRGPLLQTYGGRILNIHPSLLPKFGGPGMYGERVHRAVLSSGDRESGCTVHLVDAGIDTGPVLLQRRVPVFPGDTAASLAERVHGAEHAALVEAAALMARRISKTKEPLG
ncbi:MAG: phosphoribosylglycinamide formyltransferase [Treponema sp.]|nr:phosphoribosylglycinamide formyltransferase [Treponema sp.]